MLQSIGAAHTLTQDSFCAQEAAKKILLGYDIESYIRDSFSTVLPSILVGNMKETTGGAYECLVGNIKGYSIWNLCVAQVSSGPRAIIWEGTETVTGRLKRLRNNLATDPELKELSMYLATDYAPFISEFLELFNSQNEEYIETSTFPPEQVLTSVLDFMVLILEELHEGRAEVMDTGQHVPGMFIWRFIKAWEIQELYHRNQFKDNPVLTRRLVGCMLVHDVEQYFKAQIAQIEKHGERIISIQEKVTDNHKEMISHQNKFISILEGMEKKK